MADPMTTERRAEIREHLARTRALDMCLDDWHMTLAADARDLLAEVERLRAELDLAFSPGMYLDIQKVLDEALGTNKADGAGAGIVADVALVADRMKQAEAERDRAGTVAANAEKTLGEQIDRAIKAEEQRNQARARVEELAGLRDGLRTEVAEVEAERDDAQRTAAVLQSAVDEANRRINLALRTAAELHEFNSPEGEHLDGCPGCRLENELGEARPDPRLEALEALAARYGHAFAWLYADAKARATRKEGR